MNRLSVFISCISILLAASSCRTEQTTRVDVLIVGGSTSGISAGVQSARLGATTLIAEPTEWLGGMLTAAGVTGIDGNIGMRAGLFGEFTEELEKHYGSAETLRTGWVSYAHFEPSVGNAIFHAMAEKEKNLTVWKGAEFLDAGRSGDIWNVRFQIGDGSIRTVEAKVMIDATELGDVAKACGVGYDLGMESREETGEDIAPEHANHIIQDLTWAATLKDYGRDVTIPRPEGYDPAEFACSCINDNCVTPKEPGRMWSPEMMITYGKLPNDKYMINWPIEGNDYYVDVVEMSPAEREKALEPAKARTMRFLYFIQTELGMNTLGLADDEFPTEDLLPLIPYHRESRRIHGKVRFTLNHVTKPFDQPEKLYRTSIAVGDYPVDHHHQRYSGAEELPNLYFYPIPSYGVPLGALIPRDTEGLIVAEKSISVSNIVNGASRVQPVVMQIGQAAGTLAALAVEQNKQVDEVPVRDVQNAILSAGGYLMPYLDVEVSDPMFGALQRVGSTGIMRGEGKSVGWSNQTWFRTGDPLLSEELEGLTEIYPSISFTFDGQTPVTVAGAVELLSKITTKDVNDVATEVEKTLTEYGLGNEDPFRTILRGEMAVLLDTMLDPFSRGVDIKGSFTE